MKKEDVDKKYFKELKKIESEYTKLIDEFDFSFPKITNLQREKKKFFRAISDDMVYNPQFKFEKRRYDEEKIKEFKHFKPKNLKFDPYNFKKLYVNKLLIKYYQLECFRNWGNEKSTKYSILYHGRPSYLLLLKAKKFCRNYRREVVKFKTLTPRIIGERLRKEVFRLTKDKIRIKYLDLPNKMSISPSSKLIRINPNQRYTSRDLRRLKVHEIGVHYLRYYNGRKRGIDLLMSGGTKGYVETEEGLAAYVEELKGVTSQAQMYVYAGRVIAAYYATRKSFYDIFQILRSFGFKDETAFALTARVKRNVSDTSKPLGFIKDYAYFQGYYKVKKFAKKHDLKELFIGKITIDDYKLLKKYINKHKHKIKTIF